MNSDSVLLLGNETWGIQKGWGRAGVVDICANYHLAALGFSQVISLQAQPRISSVQVQGLGAYSARLCIDVSSNPAEGQTLN